MSARKKFWLLLLTIYLGILTALIGGGVWVLDGVDSEQLRLTITVYLIGASLASVAVLALAWMLLDITLIQPIESLGRTVEVMAHTNPLQAAELPPQDLLGTLPKNLERLGKQLHQARNEIDIAFESGVAQAETTRQHLETVLRELDLGVMVCSPDGKILLHNPAVNRILGRELEVGLGRSVFNLFTRQTLNHILQVLQVERHSRDSQLPPPSREFICSSTDGNQLHLINMTLLAYKNEPISAFILTFKDTSVDFIEGQQRDRLLQEMVESFRAPLGTLRAAIETLHDLEDIPQVVQQTFIQIANDESLRLSDCLAQMNRKRQQLSGLHLERHDIYSSDLVGLIARRFPEDSDIQIEAVGIPLWLHLDTHGIVETICLLINQISKQKQINGFQIEAMLGDRRVYLDMIWDGKPIPDTELSRWLDIPLSHFTQATTPRDIINSHNTDIWSQPHRRDGRALLRLPLPASPRQWEPARPILPSRPEFYDFDLSRRGQLPSSLMETALDRLNLVVFDTETTGLRPSAGDQIVSIGAVRIVAGRLLWGETFERMVNPGIHIPSASTRFHGITDDMVKDKPPIEQVLSQFHEFVGNSILVAHNAAFDMKFIRLSERDSDISFDNPVLDTLLLSVYLQREERDHTLDGIATRLGVEIHGRHTAIGDTLVTADVFLNQIGLLAAKGIHSLGDALKASDEMVEIRKRQEEF